MATVALGPAATGAGMFLGQPVNGVITSTFGTRDFFDIRRPVPANANAGPPVP